MKWLSNPEVTKEMTGMELGGVTPIGLPATLPLWIDSRVMQCEKIILGGGNRSSKLLLPPQGLLKLPNSEVVEGLANLIPTD
jgi:prolyl-tRNA editing enzyme YbaK/EbsC (Cys-tRNA(Pro) deacylase)